MDTTPHDLPTLFRQLGLPAEPADIDRFVATHRPLPAGTKLTEAPFWSAAQARFLREEIMEDAEWAPAVDQLNVLLSPEPDLGPDLAR